MPDSGLLFGHRYGHQPLPERLKLQELTQDARTAIWNCLCEHVPIYRMVRASVVPRVRFAWDDILESLHKNYFRERFDEFSVQLIWQRMDHVINQEEFWRVFSLIESVLRHQSCPRQLSEAMQRCFHETGLAYEISLAGTPTIVPAATDAEGEAILSAMNELAESGLEPALRHLAAASECINAEDHSGAIRESIHAVESVARTLDPKASHALKPALDALEKKDSIHPALRGAMSKLYGYTSDEQGVRHALLDRVRATVGVEEAIFMFGSCAAFCGYMARKRRRASDR